MLLRIDLARFMQRSTLFGSIRTAKIGSSVISKLFPMDHTAMKRFRAFTVRHVCLIIPVRTGSSCLPITLSFGIFSHTSRRRPRVDACRTRLYQSLPWAGDSGGSFFGKTTAFDGLANVLERRVEAILGRVSAGSLGCLSGAARHHRFGGGESAGGFARLADRRRGLRLLRMRRYPSGRRAVRRRRSAADWGLGGRSAAAKGTGRRGSRRRRSPAPVPARRQTGD